MKLLSFLSDFPVIPSHLHFFQQEVITNFHVLLLNVGFTKKSQFNEREIVGFARFGTEGQPMNNPGLKNRILL